MTDLRELFPNVRQPGGALYHLALNDIFCNFVTEEDNILLNRT